MNLFIICLIIFGFICVFGVGTLIYKSILKRALKDKIRPYFKNLGYEVEKVESIGIFSFPDDLGFKDEDPSAFLGWGRGGKPVNFTYIYLFIRNIKGKYVRIPARIKTVFFSITKVEYGKDTKLN